MKVLIATDGTGTAIDAARTALRMLREDAELYLVTVVQDYEDPLEVAGGFEGPLVTPEEAEEEYQRNVIRAQSALERTRAALGREADVRLVPSQEDPGHAIVEVAAQLRPDLIVLGCKEKGFFQRLLIGSFSVFVMRHAFCPVLVAPHRGATS